MKSSRLLTGKCVELCLIGNTSKYSKSALEIPGPRYLPILGPLNSLITIGSAAKLHLTIDNYHRKYGDIFHLKLGPVDSVFISSGEKIRQMFNHEGKYPKHILPQAWNYFNQKHDIKRGLLFMDNEEWLKYRQPLNNHLLKDTQWCEKLTQQTCDNFVNKIKRIVRDERVDNLEDEIYLWSTYLIVNLMVGSTTFSSADSSKKQDELDENIWKFVKVSGDIMRLTANLNQIPVELADRFNMKVWKTFENATMEAIELSKLIVEMFDNDIECKEIGLYRKLLADGFSRSDISRILIDLLIAAGDTSTYTVLWILHHIAKDTNLQEKLRSANALVTNEVEASELMRGTIKEVLRLYPVAPFISRFLDSDAKFGDFIIPKGWLVVASMFTAGRCAENYSTPLEFAPDRWKRAEHKQQRGPDVLKPQAFVPFAMGARSCVGRKVATFEINCLISKILRNFHMKSLNKEKVNFKLELVGVPDKKIHIAFRNLD